MTDDTAIEILQRLTRVETKLDGLEKKLNGQKRNGSLDLKTWLIIAAMLFGGGAANYGLQTAVQGQPQVKIIPGNQIDYSAMGINGR